MGNRAPQATASAVGSRISAWCGTCGHRPTQPNIISIALVYSVRTLPKDDDAVPPLLGEEQRILALERFCAARGYAVPNMVSPEFGQITSAGNPRAVQIGARFSF